MGFWELFLLYRTAALDCQGPLSRSDQRGTLDAMSPLLLLVRSAGWFLLDETSSLIGRELARQPMIGWGLPRLTRGSFSKRSTSFRYWNYWPKFWTRPIILLAKSCSIFSNTKFFLMVFSDHISDLVHWGRKRLTNVILWKFVKTLTSFTLTFWMNLTLASLRPQLVYIQTYCIWTLSKKFFFSLWLISSNWGKIFWNVLDQNLWS